MTTARPTIGVIGLGYGRAHIPAFQANGCQVVAVCQRDPATATAVAKRYGVPQVFTQWEELLERARPDVVVIATPPRLHHPIALRAFAQGAHVLCEKPLALTAADAEAMVAAAQRAGRVGMTAFNWRFPPAMQVLHRRVAAGDIGRVFHASASWLGGRFADEAVPSTWRMDRAQAGHGAMGDMGVHLIDLVRATAGDFRRLVAHAGIAHPTRGGPGGPRSADAEDFCVVVAELASGAQVTVTVSRVARGVTEHRLELYGVAGALAYRLGREGARWWEGELRAASGGDPFRPVTVDAPGPPDPIDGDALDVTGVATIGPLVGRLLAAIRTGERPAPSFEDGLHAQRVLDAVAASVRTRSWVDVAPGGPPPARG
jgi:predicted dehydrogenase